MKTVKSVLIFSTLALTACGDEFQEPDLGTRVKYTVSEFGPDALGTAILSGYAGGCLPASIIDYSQGTLQELKSNFSKRSTMASMAWCRGPSPKFTPQEVRAI
jgi:hypothetical protein